MYFHRCCPVIRLTTSAGDGRTDDTAVLNLAFKLAAEWKQPVFLPAGSYIVTDTVFVSQQPTPPSALSFYLHVLNVILDSQGQHHRWCVLVSDCGLGEAF